MRTPSLFIRFALFWIRASVGATLILTGLLTCAALAQEPPPARLLIASDRGREGLMRLFMMNADGTQPKRLTQGEDVEPEGVLSADGKRVAFTIADPKQNSSALWVMNADGSGRKRLVESSPKSQAFAPAWSPDGKQIAYSVLEKEAGKPGRASLWRIDADGMHPKSLGEGLIPSWSPDGKTLLYTRYDKDAKGEPALYTMDPDGGKARRLVVSAAMGVWSPDGKRIAYMGAGEARPPDLYVSDADGGHPKQLTHGKDEMICGPQWSADGSRIFFTMVAKEQAGGFHLYALTLEGNKRERLTREGTMNFIGHGSTLFLLIAADPNAK